MAAGGIVIPVDQAISTASTVPGLAEERRRATTGDVRAEITKILWVATTPA
jgi:hypothetical protein